MWTLGIGFIFFLPRLTVMLTATVTLGSGVRRRAQSFL